MKDNKLIAEFMGLKHKNGDFFIPKTSRGYVGGDWLSQEELQFHSEWNWLMPVLSKILDLSFQDDGDAEDFYSIRDCVPDINHTHKAVVEFIKDQVCHIELQEWEKNNQ